MNNEEINKICDWVDKNITRYIGWNEWGSLRIVNPDNFKRDLKSIFEEKEPPFEELDGREEIRKVQELLQSLKNDYLLVITKHDFGILKQ